jgi:hypothetical protein
MGEQGDQHVAEQVGGGLVARQQQQQREVRDIERCQRGVSVLGPDQRRSTSSMM